MTFPRLHFGMIGRRVDTKGGEVGSDSLAVLDGETVDNPCCML